MLNTKFIECFVTTSVFLSLLLVGTVWPDKRIIFLGIPLNIFMAFFAMFFVLIKNEGRCFTKAAIKLTPVSIVFCSLLYSVNAEYGIYKSINLYLVSLLCLALIIYIHNRYDEQDVFKSIVIFLSLILLLAFVYKIKKGFWNREVLFLFNGPIVFARLMSIALILALFIKTSRPVKFFSCAVFILSILWAQSKGPILAVVFCLYYLAYKELAREKFIVLTLFIACLALTLYFIPAYLINLLEIDSPLLNRILLAFSGSDEANYGSIGSRFLAYDISIDIFNEHPFFGVGVGSWSSFAENISITYPHNLFLEVFTELGLFLGLVFIFRYFDFFRSQYNAYTVIALMFFISQMVSGDLLDSRYLLVFSIFSLLYGGAANKKCLKNQ